VIRFLDYFCATVTILTCDFLNVWISYLFRPTRLSYYSSKLSNVWEKSTFQIWQNYPAPVGFLPEPDFCRIWKVPDSGRSWSWNLVQPYFIQYI